MQASTEKASKAVTPKAPAGALAPIEKWSGSGMGAGVTAADVLIPKLLVMQQMSELVTDEKAKSGEVIRSTSKELLGGRGKLVPFIPLICTKTWVIFELDGNSPKFRGVEPFLDPNLPWEWTDGTKKMRRDQAINLYALLPGDIDREAAALEACRKTGDLPDPDCALIPVMLQFRRTGYNVGREIITHFAKADSFGLPAATTTFGLDTEKVDGEKGTYYVPKLQKVGPTDRKHLEGSARKWFEIIAKSGAELKVDDSDLVQEEKPVGPGAPLGREAF